jgi:hypothetical protein
VLVVDTLDHELESFGCIGFGIKAENVLLVKYFEELPPHVASIQDSAILTVLDLLKELLKLLAKLCFWGMCPLREVNPLKERDHLDLERVDVPEHLHDHVQIAVEHTIRV